MACDPSDNARLSEGSGPQKRSQQTKSAHTLSSVRQKYASQQDALNGLAAFVKSLGVEHPASTERELLMQAAPYMSESLDANLQNAWSAEDRARLDAAPIPKELDFRNRDHEYIFFKQMRQSLERRMSRSSSNSTTRGSRDQSLELARSPMQPPLMTSMASLSPEEAAIRRAEQRRSNLGAVWGETGRDVLKALDTLPESDVLLDADGVSPPGSPKYVCLSDTQGISDGAQHVPDHTASEAPRSAAGGYGFAQARQWVTQRVRRTSMSVSRLWDQK